MGMFGKVLVGILAALVVVVAGAGGAAWWMLSRFDARAEIVKRVKAATGRDFALAGPVSVSFWPTLGFRGQGAALANVRGGMAPHLLEAKEIIIGVALRPLVETRRVEVSRFVLVEPVLALEVDAQGLPNWILTPQAPPPSSAPPRAERRVSDVRLAGAEIRDGAVSYINMKTGSAYALTSINLMADMAGLDSALGVKGDLSFKDTPFTVDVSLGNVRAAMTGRQTSLAWKLGSGLVDTTFDGAITAASGALEGRVTAQGPNLRTLAAWAGAPLGAGYGLEPFALAGQLTVGPRRYAFENAGLAIDALRARGDFVVETGAARPLISGRLEVAEHDYDPLVGTARPGQRMLLDLNPYMASRIRTAGAAPAAEPASVEVAALQPVDVNAGGWSEARFNFGWMDVVNAQLEITTGPLKIHNVTIDNAALSFVLLDGYLSATLGRMELYGGQGFSRLEIDARQPDIVVRNEIAAQNLRAKDFFRDAFGFTNIDGTAKVEWGLASRGGTQKALMETSTGAGSVTFTNGALSGVDLGGVARTIRNAMRRELVSPSAKTPFTVLRAGFRAKDGVIATQDLRLEAADAKLNAVGVIDLGKRSLDMRIVPRLGVTALAVPFRVQGPWKGLDYQSDFLGRARAEVEGKARAVYARAPTR